MSDLVDSFERIVAGAGDAGDVCAALDAAGFLDALVPGERGGAGLTLGEVEPLLRALGRHGVSAPVAETMALRATGADALARPLGAVLAAAEIAGLGERLLAMTIEHANTREQFGKPIGKLQAIQQQLAVMAEQVVLTRTAAQLGLAQGMTPNPLIAAVAKHTASAAVPVITGIAHAVHGAIGMTRDYPLGALVARANALRAAWGSEGYWARIIGAARLARSGEPSLDFVRSVMG